MEPKTLPHEMIETGRNPQHCIIWLHGLGADGHDFEPIVPQLGLDPSVPVRFIFPHAPSIPVTINGGYVMPAWYDIRQTDLGIAHDHPGIDASAKAIRLLIEQQQMQGINIHNIILAGFSQGAAMALHTGLRMGQALAGIIALSGYLLMSETLPDAITQASREIPIFMAHGIHDPVVPFALGDRAQRQLRDFGFQVEWHSYPMEHQVCMEEIRHIGGWIQEILSSPSSSSAST